MSNNQKQKIRNGVLIISEKKINNYVLLQAVYFYWEIVDQTLFIQLEPKAVRLNH